MPIKRYRNETRREAVVIQNEDSLPNAVREKVDAGAHAVEMQRDNMNPNVWHLEFTRTVEVD